MLDSYILVKPSNKLQEFIKELQIKDDMPPRIGSMVEKKTMNGVDSEKINEFVTKENDFSFVSSIDKKLNNENVFSELLTNDIRTFSPKDDNEGYLEIEDLLWLNSELEQQRKNGNCVYLHELLTGSSIYVPENEKIERNPDLEKRCIKLKNQQDNQKYRNMTRNVDNMRAREPEETIAYQLNQMNRQLIAVFQFILSVLAGFLFGFLGVELIVGNLDFGFRLLLGIMCALTIALAELYFLAKQLVEC